MDNGIGGRRAWRRRLRVVARSGDVREQDDGQAAIGDEIGWGEGEQLQIERIRKLQTTAK